MDIIDKFFFVGLTATLLAFLSVCTFVCYDVFHGRIKYPVEYILIIMIGLLWVIMLFLSTVIGTTNISEKVGVYYNKEFGTLIGIFSFWLMNTMIRYYKYVFFILSIRFVYKDYNNFLSRSSSVSLSSLPLKLANVFLFSIAV